MNDPWQVTRKAYMKFGDEGSYAYKEGDKIRRAMELESEGEVAHELMAVAITSDEQLRQMHNFDPTDKDSDVRFNLELLWDICNEVANHAELKKVLNK